MLVSCSSDCTARIWYEELSAPESKGHAPGSKYIAGPVLSGHASGVLDVAFGEQWIVTSSRDKTLRVWRRSDLAYVHTYYGHSASVNACCLQDGIVASGAGDGSIHIWDVATGQPRTVIRGPHCGISSIILSGSLVFTGSSDKVIRIWDADEGVLLSVFQAHDQLVRDLSYDPERKLLISGGWDGVTRLWNIAPTLSAPRTLSPEMLLPAPEFLWEKCVHHGRVFGVCFNSTRVVSSCEDRVLMVANFGNYGLPTHLYT
ncbi:hypothetical protein MVES_000957 [Malassezia vespertilionis]|uniref:Uncharacterized protein n=1 Tax=Malassezia vespertilionis TaxID=2020962 RepID=A0A2N1JFI1_9BASI|nr:hypothetical protein MVES_000957 [Malassezia vespertilionis]